MTSLQSTSMSKGASFANGLAVRKRSGKKSSETAASVFCKEERKLTRLVNSLLDFDRTTQKTCLQRESSEIKVCSLVEEDTRSMQCTTVSASRYTHTHTHTRMIDHTHVVPSRCLGSCNIEALLHSQTYSLLLFHRSLAFHTYHTPTQCTHHCNVHAQCTMSTNTHVQCTHTLSLSHTLSFILRSIRSAVVCTGGRSVQHRQRGEGHSDPLACARNHGVESLPESPGQADQASRLEGLLRWPGHQDHTPCRWPNVHLPQVHRGRQGLPADVPRVYADAFRAH
jgi:hypothetical protein